MQNAFSIVPSAAVKEVLSQDLLSTYHIIEKAYLAHEAGNTVLPGSYFLKFPENPQSRIIALPGYIAEEFKIAGIKWISSNPKNLTQGLPRASAVIILNDPDTGRPFACLEGSLISAARTAASAVLAAEHMHPYDKNLANLGIVGNGPIAAEIYQYFINTGWNIKELTIFDLNKSTSQAFLAKIEPTRHKTIYIAQSVEKLIQSCDAVVFTTTVASPYLHDLNLIKHCPLILNISLRDIGSEIMLSAHNVVDDISHVLNGNTSPHLTQQVCGHTEFINGTLGGLMQNKYQLTTNKTSIFSPMGLGILDLALAKYVFDKTIASNNQITINNFLGDGT